MGASLENFYLAGFPGGDKNTANKRESSYIKPVSTFFRKFTGTKYFFFV
jgi:hypothetical protein